MNLYIGLDEGTTSVKGILVNEDGEILDIQSEQLRMVTPKPGWSEQDPYEWWDATKKVIGRLSQKARQLNGSIRAISTSGQMHSLVIIDKNGHVLRNAILWCDQRTSQQCEKITYALGGEDNVLRILANPILTGFTLPKLYWVKENEYNIYAKIDKILLPKDFINYMLTGEVSTEHSDASGTMIYDNYEMKWSAYILEKFNIPKEILPKIINSNSIVGTLKKQVAEELNLDEGIVVVAGGADNACAALGICVTNPGDVMISLGTSGTVVAPTLENKPDSKGRVHFFVHTISQTRYHMGVMLSATYSLEWFKERFLSDDYETINQEVAKIPIGSNGVVFLPYLNGERTPHKDPHARGVFFGLSSYNNKWDLVRAIFEGVACGIKDSFEIIKELGLTVKNVRITGGGAKSIVWNSMLSDILNIEIQKPLINEGASYGAAILATSGHTGRNPAEISRSWFKVKNVITPSVENGEKYQKVYDKYKKIYQRLKELFAENF